MADVLGIDIGGVIMDGVREDPEWRPDPPAIEGALSAIARLHQERFQARCWLVSRCKAEAEVELMTWLLRHSFFEATGIDPQRVVFCRELYEKPEICRRKDITHFVDDRFAVLSRMIKLVPHLFCLLSRASEPEAMRHGPDGIKTVRSWMEITDALLDRRSCA